MLYPKVGDRFSLGLSADSNYVTVQTGNSSSSYQRFKLIRNDADGTYRIISNATDKALDVDNASTTNGTYVVPYAYYGGANQKWYLEKVNDYTIWDSVPQIGQSTNMWCWVTCAQMIAEYHRNAATTVTQTDAVWKVKKRLKNEKNEYEGGYLSDAMDAVEYFIDPLGDPPAERSFVFNEDGTLSAASLITYLNNGKPIYIGRDQRLTSTWERKGGHATLIYGYVTFNGVTRFLIRDPWKNDNEAPPAGWYEYTEGTDPSLIHLEGSNTALLHSEILSQVEGEHTWIWVKYFVLL